MKVTLTKKLVDAGNAKIKAWSDGDRDCDRESALYQTNLIERHAIVLDALNNIVKRAGFFEWLGTGWGEISFATLVEVLTEIKDFKGVDLIELYLAGTIAYEAREKSLSEKHFINLEAELSNLDLQFKSLENLDKEIECYLKKINNILYKKKMQ